MHQASIGSCLESRRRLVLLERAALSALASIMPMGWFADASFLDGLFEHGVAPSLGAGIRATIGYGKVHPTVSQEVKFWQFWAPLWGDALAAAG